MERKDEIEDLRRRLASLEGQPTGAPPPVQKPGTVAGGCGAIIAVLILLVIGLSMCGGGGDKESAKRSSCDDEIAAFVMSQDFVEQRLRSPRKAHFPGITERGVSVLKSGVCEFTVIAYVDAQNGFGAEIRTPYVAVLGAPETGDTWTLKSLAID